MFRERKRDREREREREREKERKRERVDLVKIENVEYFANQKRKKRKHHVNEFDDNDKQREDIEF